MESKDQSINLPFPRLSVTSKTTKKEMMEYTEKLEGYAQTLIQLQQQQPPTTFAGNPIGADVLQKAQKEIEVYKVDVSNAQNALKSMEQIIHQKDQIIMDLQSTVNNLQGELNKLKGHHLESTAVEERLMDKLVPMKRRK